MDWQPISTAPMDGTTILTGYSLFGLWTPAVIHYRGKTWEAGEPDKKWLLNDGTEFPNPTCWVPWTEPSTPIV